MPKFSYAIIALCGAVFAQDLPKPELKFKGDVRFRGDWAYSEYEEGNSSYKKSGPNSERWLQSARARIGATYGQGNWTAGLRMVTGRGMPNTANQALDNSFISKEMSFDRIYISLTNKWGSENELQGQSDVTVGKMACPFLRSKASQELIWHGETAPEGADWTVQYGPKSAKWTARVGRFWVDEIEKERDSVKTSRKVPDVFLQSQQLSLDLKAGDVSLKLGAGSHYYNDLKGHQVLGLEPTKNLGNSYSIPDTITKARAYINDFHLLEGFADLGFKAGGVPVTVGGGLVQNVKLEGERSWAWMAGGKLGEAKKKGQLELGYGYRVVGADAIIAVTSSSDLNAYSNNSRGQYASLRYMLTDYLAYDLIGHFANTVGITDADKGKRSYFNRIRTELNASF